MTDLSDLLGEAHELGHEITDSHLTKDLPIGPISESAFITGLHAGLGYALEHGLAWAKNMQSKLEDLQEGRIEVPKMELDHFETHYGKGGNPDNKRKPHMQAIRVMSWTPDVGPSD